MSLTTDLKEFARQTGFELVGISAASKLSDTEAIMLARIGDGLMGDLGWFTRERVEKVCNPMLLVPSAASVITLGIPYLLDSADDGGSGTARGRISRYALSEDYHDVLRRLMHSIEQFLVDNARGHVAAKAFVDSAPIAEREFARRSGLGWFGKSTNILTPEFGSWVFLGEIVTSIDLELDTPLKKSCGNCDLCVKSCPTGAIIGPYTIDVGRCISYLTVEHRGAIPYELRSRVGEWIFGCDVCQEVCPVNRKTRRADRKVLDPVDGLDSRPSLLEMLEMSDEEHRARFRSTPLWRAKKRGLQRNVAVALGNCGDADVISHLIRFLSNPDELVRGHVVWALGQFGGRTVGNALELHRARESSGFVLQELQLALASVYSC